MTLFVTIWDIFKIIGLVLFLLLCVVGFVREARFQNRRTREQNAKMAADEARRANENGGAA